MLWEGGGGVGAEAVKRAGVEALGSGADDGGLAAGMEEAVGRGGGGGVVQA